MNVSCVATLVHYFGLCFSSQQQSTTFTKKMIEDNNTMDETLQFLGVSSYIEA